MKTKIKKLTPYESDGNPTEEEAIRRLDEILEAGGKLGDILSEETLSQMDKYLEESEDEKGKWSKAMEMFVLETNESGNGRWDICNHSLESHGTEVKLREGRMMHVKKEGIDIPDGYDAPKIMSFCEKALEELSTDKGDGATRMQEKTKRLLDVVYSMRGEEVERASVAKKKNYPRLHPRDWKILGYTLVTDLKLQEKINKEMLSAGKKLAAAVKNPQHFHDLQREGAVKNPPHEGYAMRLHHLNTPGGVLEFRPQTKKDCYIDGVKMFSYAIAPRIKNTTMRELYLEKAKGALNG